MRTAIPTVLLFLSVAAGCGSNGSTNPGGGGGGNTDVNLDGGGAPAVPPDGAAACPAGACNYQTGSGCSGAAPSCAPILSGTTVSPGCIAPGTVAPGGACTNPGDCTAGFLCGNGVCRKLCCGGDWTGCDSPTEHCTQTLEYSTDAGTFPTSAMLCGPINDCSALQPSTCTAAGTSCQIADLTGATACLPEGTGTAGKPCPCKGGFTCVTPPAEAPVCARLCAAVSGGAQPYCQAGEGICTHYTRDPAGVGECQPP